MLDQSFSCKNFKIIYNIENRKGNIDLKDMPDRFKDILEKIKQENKEISNYKKKKKKNWTLKEKSNYDILIKERKENLENKDKELDIFLDDIVNHVNKNFNFTIETKELNNKNVFYIPYDNNYKYQFFVLKLLQQNISKTFKVKQANRHQIMSNLYLLMNTSLPFYLIRTDISQFYESIPQKELLDKIDNNTLLTFKSKAFIHDIINKYEKVKPSNITEGLGIPRGIGISSFLSEIYMRDIDNKIKSKEEVIFYARYVDDIIILISKLEPGTTLEDYYTNLIKLFSNSKLTLKKEKESEKCQLLDFYTKRTVGFSFYYLGYNLYWKKDVNKLSTIFGLSENKKLKIKKRIDNAFDHYSKISKKNLHQANRDLIDSLHLIYGNIRLYKSKHNVKVGLFYNNDLLTRLEDLKKLNGYIKNKKIEPYEKLFQSDLDKTKYIKSIENRINKINFYTSWENKKMYGISLERIKEIKKWL